MKKIIIFLSITVMLSCSKEKVQITYVDMWSYKLDINKKLITKDMYGNTIINPKRVWYEEYPSEKTIEVIRLEVNKGIQEFPYLNCPSPDPLLPDMKYEQKLYNMR